MAISSVSLNFPVLSQALLGGVHGGGSVVVRASKYDYYEVVKGDSLSKIAKRIYSTVPYLAKLNRISAPHQIQVGQTLKIPARDF
ncbi:MAG TPA: hypothetical protein DDW49_02680 [Deltaproteobacteria bacterium]|nr:MAG: hypothetical protein A2048_00720 [Deltaproteobacteria bacterium GWA2_45_12]HBF12284.1 hypothetical protein [Deltaproteobacteria bacterium]